MHNRRNHRLTEPTRHQGVIRFEMPDEVLPVDHQARVLWQAFDKLDLSAFLNSARSMEGSAGRPTHSPQMMLTLWSYAISQGVGSAREISRLVKSDSAYGWIVGSVEVSHHMLSKFRVGHAAALDNLMSDVLAALMHKGVLTLGLVAQDGMRIRAAASAPSFRTLESLHACREQAALHLKAVLAQADDPSHSLAQKAMREAGARDFQRRIEEAIATAQDLQQTRDATDKPVRVSTSDAEARVMKMGDGGFRPALNLQMATAGSEMGGPRTIVGVNVCNVGSDMGSITPMLDQIERRTGQLPETLLADSNHANHAAIADAKARGTTLLVPVPKRSKEAKNGDQTPAVQDWKSMMETPEAKELYRARAGLCELMNAHVTHRFGLRQFLVRGIAKATSVALLIAITSNITQHIAAFAN